MISGISWVVIGVLVIVFLLLLKFRHVRHRFFAIVLILLLAFVYFTSTTLLADTDVDFKSLDGWISLGKVYLSWLGHAFGNAKVVTGEAIKMDWIGNSTNISEK